MSVDRTAAAHHARTLPRRATRPHHTVTASLRHLAAGLFWTIAAGLTATARRWRVVRQRSNAPDEPVRERWWHRFGVLAELHAHRLSNRERERGVFYTAYPNAREAAEA
jgi:hypothetical protein